MLLVPTTSGGWKALAVVAQSAAAAAAFVGDLTIFAAYPSLLRRFWSLSASCTAASLLTQLYPALSRRSGRLSPRQWIWL